MPSFSGRKKYSTKKQDMWSAGMRQATPTNFIAGPLGGIAAQYTPKNNYKVILNNNILTGIYLLFKMFLLASFKISCKSFSAYS